MDLFTKTATSMNSVEPEKYLIPYKVNSPRTYKIHILDIIFKFGI